MRVAHQLGMPLGQCMRSHTQRQIQVWLAWLRMQWDIPDRHDYYAMQIATEVRRGYVKDPGKVDGNIFKIKFKDNRHSKGKGGKLIKDCTPEEIAKARREAIKRSQAGWFTAFARSGFQVPENSELGRALKEKQEREAQQEMDKAEQDRFLSTD